MSDEWKVGEDPIIEWVLSGIQRTQWIIGDAYIFPVVPINPQGVTVQGARIASCEIIDTGILQNYIALSNIQIDITIHDANYCSVQEVTGVQRWLQLIKTPIDANVLGLIVKPRVGNINRGFFAYPWGLNIPDNLVTTEDIINQDNNMGFRLAAFPHDNNWIMAFSGRGTNNPADTYIDIFLAIIG